MRGVVFVLVLALAAAGARAVDFSVQVSGVVWKRCGGVGVGVFKPISASLSRPRPCP